MSDLQSMLLQLKTLQDQIELAIAKESRQYEDRRVHIELKYDENACEWQDLKKEYSKHLKTNHYYLITCTFDTKISVNLDAYGQTVHLKNILNEFDKYHYFCCFEKHKSGILHSHILIQGDDHKMRPLLEKSKKHITKSPSLSPAIQIKRVNDTDKDIKRTYDYIWDDKPDHPVYKHLFISI